jgi:hypothetical protein
MYKKFVITACLFTCLIFQWSCQETIDVESEKQAIKAVLESETQEYLNQDFDNFAANWVQEPYVLWLYAGKDNLIEKSSWDSVGAFFKNMFDTSPPPAQSEVIRSNFIFRIYGNVAWVTYDETIKRNGGNGETNSKPFKELRLLEKGRDGWKIVFVGNFNRDSY